MDVNQCTISSSPTWEAKSRRAQSLATSALAWVNMFLHAIDDFQVVCDDIFLMDANVPGRLSQPNEPKNAKESKRKADDSLAQTPRQARCVKAYDT